jgi:hypothetical protein
VKRCEVGGRTVHGGVAEEVAGGNRRVGVRGRALGDVRLRRHLGDRECLALLAGPLAECVAAASMDGRSALQVRQRERGLSIAAKGGAQQREQRLAVVDRRQLPVAQRSSPRLVPEGHDPDLGKEWFCHRFLLVRGSTGRWRVRLR